MELDYIRSGLNQESGGNGVPAMLQEQTLDPSLSLNPSLDDYICRAGSMTKDSIRTQRILNGLGKVLRDIGGGDYRLPDIRRDIVEKYSDYIEAFRPDGNGQYHVTQQQRNGLVGLVEDGERFYACNGADSGQRQQVAYINRSAEGSERPGFIRIACYFMVRMVGDELAVRQREEPMPAAATG